MGDGFSQHVAKPDVGRVDLDLSLAEALGVQEAIHGGHRVEQGSAHDIEIIDGVGQARFIDQFALDDFDHEKDAVKTAAKVVGKKRQIFALRFAGGLELTGEVIDKSHHAAAHRGHPSPRSGP